MVGSAKYHREVRYDDGLRYYLHLVSGDIPYEPEDQPDGYQFYDRQSRTDTGSPHRRHSEYFPPIYVVVC